MGSKTIVSEHEDISKNSGKQIFFIFLQKLIEYFTLGIIGRSDSRKDGDSH